MRRGILVSFLVFFLIGCKNHIPFVYKMDIQQGNIVEEDVVAQLEPGMTQEQVLFLLGNPIASDTFQQHRWDYVYYLKPNRKPVQEKYLVVWFNDDKTVSHYDFMEKSGKKPSKES
jgi:outer membrane protein assembly factor BamE